MDNIKLIREYLNKIIDKYGYIFNKNEFDNLFNKKTQDKIKDLIGKFFNGKIIIIKDLNLSNKEILKKNMFFIISKICYSKFKYNYCIIDEYALSLYTHSDYGLNKFNITIYNNSSNNIYEIKDNNTIIGEINYISLLKNLKIGFEIIPKKQQSIIYNLNIISKEELLLRLFNTKISHKFTNSIYSPLKEKFVRFGDFNIKKISEIINNNNLYILDEIYKYIKEKEINNSSINILLEKYGIIKEKTNSININQESIFIKSFKEMIDKIIKYNNNLLFVKDLNNLNKIKKGNTKQSIIDKIIKNQKDEIYHSTTIEGYKVNKEDIDFVLYKQYPELIKSNEQKIEFEKNIENILIIKSYKKAFDFIIDLLKNNNNENIINDDLLKEINYHTFYELYQLTKCGIMNIEYRNHTVRMNGTEGFLPPEDRSDIIILIDYLLSKYKDVQNPILRAFTLHFLLIPIQPFGDGNGRLSRFLMNIISVLNGYNWIIVKDNNYRLKYLSSWGLLNNNNINGIKDVYFKFVNYLLQELVLLN